jgi:hypothetical protein
VLRAEPLSHSTACGVPGQGDGAAGASFFSYGGQGGVVGGGQQRPSVPTGGSRPPNRGGVNGNHNKVDRGAGKGGGAVLLVVENTFTLEGTIEAYGTDATEDGAGGGSGGVVDIASARFDGDGHILAYGGRGYGHGGGGAGGAVSFTNQAKGNFDEGRVSARGGLSDVSESLNLEGGEFGLTSNSGSRLSEQWFQGSTRSSYYEPNRGRLNMEREVISSTERRADGWMPSSVSASIYLQVTLNQPRFITGLATQGE